MEWALKHLQPKEDRRLTYRGAAPAVARWLRPQAAGSLAMWERGRQFPGSPWNESGTLEVGGAIMCESTQEKGGLETGCLRMFLTPPTPINAGSFWCEKHGWGAREDSWIPISQAEWRRKCCDMTQPLSILSHTQPCTEGLGLFPVTSACQGQWPAARGSYTLIQ